MKINLFIKSRFKSYSVIIQDKGVNKSNLKPYVANRNNILIISDSGIPKKYINDLKKTIRLCGVSARVLTISNGEQSKSFKNYQYILEHLAEKNFARDDLIIALSTNVIAGAGIDVYEKEPLPSGHKLRFVQNALLLPHLGYVTAENYSLFYSQMIENLEACTSGKPIRLIK